jgi:hypothetical protein
MINLIMLTDLVLEALLVHEFVAFVSGIVVFVGAVIVGVSVAGVAVVAGKEGQKSSNPLEPGNDWQTINKHATVTSYY